MSKVQKELVAHFMRATVMGKGVPETSACYAMAQSWADAAIVATDFKAISGAMTTSDYAATAVAADFSATVRARTVVGRLTAARRIPPLCRVLTSRGGSSADFVGQGSPIKVSKMDLSGGVLDELKICGLGAFDKELLRSSSPQADAALAEDLAAACIEAMDRAFLDPNNPGIANEKPAAVTHGAPSMTSTGVAFAEVDTDLSNMLQMLVAAGSDMLNAVWILRPETAISLSSLRDTAGALAYPQISVLGGILKGVPVLVSAALAEPGSPPSGSIVLLDQSQVTYVDEGAAKVEVFDQGSLQMLDNPTNNSASGTATTMVSLFQTNSAAFRGTLWINWTLRRPYVVVLSGVTY